MLAIQWGSCFFFFKKHQTMYSEAKRMRKATTSSQSATIISDSEDPASNSNLGNKSKWVQDGELTVTQHEKELITGPKTLVNDKVINAVQGLLKSTFPTISTLPYTENWLRALIEMKRKLFQITIFTEEIIWLDLLTIWLKILESIVYEHTV